LKPAAAKGKSFIIAKAGKPMVKVVPLDDAPVARQRLGFMQGAIIVPDDFDTIDQAEIESLFGVDE
jgi:antitoxin (DNA-binding transcriptional repressor) of toxin-antitoxin stability system